MKTTNNLRWRMAGATLGMLITVQAFGQSAAVVRIAGSDGLGVYGGAAGMANASAIASIAGAAGGDFEMGFPPAQPDLVVATADAFSPVGDVIITAQTGWHGSWAAPGGGNWINSLEISSSQTIQTDPAPFNASSALANMEGAMEATFVAISGPPTTAPAWTLTGAAQAFCYGTPETNFTTFPGSDFSSVDGPERATGSNAVSAYVSGTDDGTPPDLIFINASFLGAAGWHIVTNPGTGVTVDQTAPGTELNQTVIGDVQVIPFFTGGAYHMGVSGIWETSMTAPGGAPAEQHFRAMVVDAWGWVHE